MTIREGSWDCPSCGAVGQRGRDTSCRSCRRPRPGNVDFYLPRDAPAVDAGYQLEQANAGPDWTCDRCRRANRATEATCSGCFAGRGDSAARSVHEYARGTAPATGRRVGDPRAAPLAAAPERAWNQGTPRMRWNRRRVRILSAVLAVVGVAAALFCFVLLPFIDENPVEPTEATGEVAGLQWRRFLTMEKRIAHDSTDWSHPPEAEVLRAYPAVREVKRVFAGYRLLPREGTARVKVGTRRYACTRDLGNGYFEDTTCERDVYETRPATVYDSVPVTRTDTVYATRYDYRVYSWRELWPELTSAHGGAAPPWPTVEPTPDTRFHERYSTWEVKLRYDGGAKEKAMEVDSARFAALRVGQPVRITLRRGRHNLDSVIGFVALTAEAGPGASPTVPPPPADSLVP